MGADGDTCVVPARYCLLITATGEPSSRTPVNDPAASMLLLSMRIELAVNDLLKRLATLNGESAPRVSFEATAEQSPIAASNEKQEPRTTQERLVRAYLLRRDDPERSDREIAKEVGVSPSTLTRDPTYQEVLKQSRKTGRRVASGLTRRHAGDGLTLDAIADD